MVKLVHITTVPETLGFFTGQVRFMERRGFEVHALSSPGARLDRFCCREHVHAHSVEMTRHITPLRDLAALFRIWRVFRRIRPTIVHAHTPKAGLLGMLAAISAGVPVRVFEIHGLPYLTASGLRRLLLRWATSIACRLSHRVLCVSTSVRDVAICAGLSPDWKITVPAGGSVNGVDAVGVFNPVLLAPDSSDEVRARYGISRESVVMGFVGRLVRDKGVVELAGAWTLMRDEFPALDWLLVGDAEPHNPLPPHVLAQLLGDPRIHWARWLDDLPEIYSAMNLLVLPSHREGFPVVALEAAAMGLPVVTTRVPGCIDAVEDGITGLLVEPRDPQRAGRRAEDGAWLEHERLGYNYRLSDLNCALGVAQLLRLDTILARRAAVANRYNEILLDRVPYVAPPAPAAPETSISWFVYVVRLREDFSRRDRDAVLEHLRAAGIGCRNYFSPIHLQPFYRRTFGFAPGDFPVAEQVAERTIALPFFGQLPEADILTVCDSLACAIRQRKRTCSWIAAT